MPKRTHMYGWPARSEFANRAADLEAMEKWWASSTRDALALIGRRRVGKSWAFKAFAHGRPAVVLTADQVLTVTQMARFADQLEPLLGVRPGLPDLATLFRVLYRLGERNKILVIIDEFPFLLPEGAARTRVLTELLAVMEEEREASATKLLLCGSLIGQMESLLAQSSPLHGRIQRLDIWPLDFSESRHLMPSTHSDIDRVQRYAVAGGMAKYLASLGEDRPLKDAVCELVLDRRGPLFDDPRNVLEQELRSPATYFSVLEELAHHPVALKHLTNALQLQGPKLSFYLSTLKAMRLISTELPVGAPSDARTTRYAIDDGFIRFWFRFVFPNQDNLSGGLSPENLWNGEISLHLADFVAPTFEKICARWTRTQYGATAQRVGGWWGPALNKHRQDDSRTTEEVDVVGAYRKQLRLAGECKWTDGAMPLSALEDLRTFKLPAVEQEGRLKLPTDGPDILLFAKTGFSTELQKAAADDPKTRLVDLSTIISDLDATD